MEHSLLFKKKHVNHGFSMGFPWVFHGFSMASRRASSTKPRSAASVASTAGGNAAIRAATRCIALPRNACDPMTTLEFFGDLQFFSRKFSHQRPIKAKLAYHLLASPHKSIDFCLALSLSLYPSIHPFHPSLHPSIYLSG